jgi:hypothetical protein
MTDHERKSFIDFVQQDSPYVDFTFGDNYVRQYVSDLRRCTNRRAAPPSKVYAAETGGAVSGFRLAAITSGRKVSSRGAGGFAACLG